MRQENSLTVTKRWALALAFMLYPLLAGTAFALHPNLLSLRISHDVASRVAEFHGNRALHFGHLLMLLAVPLLIAIALHFMERLQYGKNAWWGYIGGLMAIAGAVVLAADKAALCLVPSAFDTLPEAQFQALLPGIEAMFHYQGQLWVLWLLPLLPLGFVLQTIGLVRQPDIRRWQSVPMLLGSLLMANPDIDIIGLAASGMLALGFVPYAIGLLREAPLPDAE